VTRTRAFDALCCSASAVAEAAGIGKEMIRGPQWRLMAGASSAVQGAHQEMKRLFKTLREKGAIIAHLELQLFSVCTQTCDGSKEA
jgi:hypothetical protein